MSRIKAMFELFLNLFRKPVTVSESYGFLPETYRGLPRRDADKVHRLRRLLRAVLQRGDQTDGY